jgi:hypothetical protein
LWSRCGHLLGDEDGCLDNMLVAVKHNKLWTIPKPEVIGFTNQTSWSSAATIAWAITNATVVCLFRLARDSQKPHAR